MAGAATPNLHDQQSAWRIDRFDLIFYNARHKRWQFFAEDPSETNIRPRTEEGLYRYQIRSLLTTFRRVVQSALLLPNPGHRGRFEIRSYEKAQGDGCIPLAKPTFDEWNDHKQIYLDYLISAGWYDGVPEGHRKELQRWFNNPDVLVSREAALTFLSLLPILEDWDTWGCFTRARNRSQSLSDRSFPPAEASGWAEPFYMVELDFRKEQPSAVWDSKSEELLDNRVSIEGLSLDLASPPAQPSRAARARRVGRMGVSWVSGSRPCSKSRSGRKEEELQLLAGDDACPERVDPGTRPDDQIDRARARAMLDEILATMPLELRSVFTLFELEQMTMIQIAGMLELPQGTVASRLRRARELFVEHRNRLEARLKSGACGLSRPTSENTRSGVRAAVREDT